MEPLPSDGPNLAVVTGAASGIGFAVARALARQGSAVAMCDRDAERLKRAVDEVAAHAARPVRAYPLDVRERAAVQATIERVEQELGAVDALASVAGVLHLGTAVPNAEGRRALGEGAWNDSLATNATGLFHLAQAIVPRMVARRRGAIVTVASNAARTPRLDMAAYAASKAAAVMFTKCLGLELAQYGIRCNVVSPGSTDTPMQRALWSDENGPARVIAGDLARYRLGIPLGRIATPDDIANVVVFLLSPAARQITLQDVCVDGGATL